MDKGKDMFIFNIIAYIITGLIAIATVTPFILLVVGSVQHEDTILKYGYSILPRGFDLTAYKFIFGNYQKIAQSYGVSIFITVVGTAVSIFFSSMTAYILARKDLKYRNKLTFYLFFTTLFNGGLVPYYILVSNYLMLKDTITILLLAGMFNVIYILIIRSYIANSIPDSISESAKIDGANDFTIFMKIIFPLLKPTLASIGLFTALGHWNDYFTALLFINQESLFPLQYLLFKMLSYASFSQSLLAKNGAVSGLKIPGETLKLALTVIATGPIVLAYPFAQRYFVAGMTIGAVKG
jgi:putative aldouronate transport system permease protein